VETKDSEEDEGDDTQNVELERMIEREGRVHQERTLLTL
jgi:hypothetical protein